MYVWELVSFRLRQEGWNVRHSSRPDSLGLSHTVVLSRLGVIHEVSGPTLTEAFAAAAKRARESYRSSSLSGPHFPNPVGARS